MPCDEYCQPDLQELVDRLLRAAKRGLLVEDDEDSIRAGRGEQPGAFRALKGQTAGFRSILELGLHSCHVASIV